MGLESVLKLVKFVDEQILRQYTKLTKKWEDKGHSRYTLSNMFNIPCTIFTLANGIDDGFIPFFQSNQFIVDNFTRGYGREFNASDSSIAENFSLQKKIDRIARLPFFVTSLGFASVGLYEVVSGFYQGDNQSVSEGLNNIAHSVPFLGVASSQYVKDSNPKLLDKEPFWRKAYDWTKEKIGSLTPRPTPQPVPIQAYSTLDSYVQDLSFL